jgi:NADH dehydrogenase (ubiquinone) 1 alpha subcomplex subunit 9
VLRLIHFSAAAADPNSPSLDFQTKFEGEKVVLKAFPNATIFRPCTVYGQNDHFAHNILRQSLFFFHKFVLVYDDCTTLKQPISEYDITQAVINALKMDETKVR